MCLRNLIERHWYQKKLTWLTILLKPFSYLFFIIILVRRYFYKIKLFKTHSLSAPVIVVGNISVGGTGKTPFIIWLAAYLQQRGFSPGIISRGVGGKKNHIANFVDINSDFNNVGDEAILLARRTNCPVVISTDRVSAGQQLLAKNNCNIIISDDGLQHYKLARNIEIALIDATREFGNQCLIPGGPLREPISRLREVNLILRNGIDFNLVGEQFISLVNQQKKVSLDFFKNKKVHAIAAIGNPQRFFAYLMQMGIEIIPHIFPDHYLFQREDIFFVDDLPIIMTEKDAVKCEKFANEKHWYLPVKVVLAESVKNKIDSCLNGYLINRSC